MGRLIGVLRQNITGSCDDVLKVDDVRDLFEYSDAYDESDDDNDEDSDEDEDESGDEKDSYASADGAQLSLAEGM